MFERNICAHSIEWSDVVLKREQPSHRFLAAVAVMMRIFVQISIAGQYMTERREARIGRRGVMLRKHGRKPSWISKVIITIEEVCDHLHHELEKAILVAGLPAKDAEVVRLHCLRPLLLKSKSVLPCEVLLVPVICGNICDGHMRLPVGRKCRLRGYSVERITPDMLDILKCVATIAMAWTAPSSFPVVTFSHFEIC